MNAHPDDPRPCWYLSPTYPLDAAKTVEQPLADITGQSRWIKEQDGTLHEIKPNPDSPARSVAR